MKKLLETYIKRCIIAEQHIMNNNIIMAIIDKFPNKYNMPHILTISDIDYTLMMTLTENKRDAFQIKYSTDEDFRNKFKSSYLFKRYSVFDFLLPFAELREYLKQEFQQSELLLLEDDKISALMISDVSSALEIAENIDEFEEMVKTLR